MRQISEHKVVISKHFRNICPSEEFVSAKTTFLQCIQLVYVAYRKLSDKASWNTHTDPLPTHFASGRQLWETWSIHCWFWK